MRARPALVLVLAAAAAAPLLAGFAGTDLFIPMAGRGVGAYPSNWFTTVYLYNPNPTAVSVDLTFLERNKDNVAIVPPKVTDTLAPGETRVYDNIVEATFGRTAYGAVRIQCAAKVVASARVFSKESADAPLTQSFGQDFAATPASFAMGLGESADILGGYTTQPYQDSAARFNIGCVETTGAGSATVRWVARDSAGQQQKSYDRVVPRLSQTQGFFHDYFAGVELTNARISATVVSGNGRVICYGSLVTNDKEFPKPVQDPTTFEMVYKDSLLGIATVQHDATLAGDGTAGAPLGIAPGGVSTATLADAAVTAAKIAPGAVGVTQLPPQVITVEKLADGAVTAPKLATSSPPAPVPAGVSAEAADPLESLFKIGETMFWDDAFTGDITGVTTAAGSGLTGGAASGDAALALANGGVTTVRLADGAVTDQKVAAGVAYSKLAGAPASLPPSGPAGGSLSGTYPSPGLSGNAVTSSVIQDGQVATVDLADGAVTDQKVATGIAYSKLSGAPASLPPSGSAGGSLSGSYPNPGLGTGAVANGNLAGDAVTTEKILDGTVSSADVGFNYAGSGSKGGAAADVTCTGCVASTELGASGSTNGQVLTSNGSAVVWGAASGLTLPYEQEVTVDSAAFFVNNHGNGSGLVGWGGKTVWSGAG
jgi:hypothetical protein